VHKRKSTRLILFIVLTFVLSTFLPAGSQAEISIEECDDQQVTLWEGEVFEQSLYWSVDMLWEINV
jgi:hypothetical protein